MNNPIAHIALHIGKAVRLIVLTLLMLLLLVVLMVMLFVVLTLLLWLWLVIRHIHFTNSAILHLVDIS